MSRRSVFLVALAAIAVAVVLSVLFVPSLLPKEPVSADEDVKFIPTSDMVEVLYAPNDTASFYRIIIEFPNTGYTVTDWGTPIIIGHIIMVNSQIWKLAGPSLQVFIHPTNIYSLGNLSNGEYYFAFKAWNSTVRVDGFDVS